MEEVGAMVGVEVAVEAVRARAAISESLKRGMVVDVGVG